MKRCSHCKCDKPVSEFHKNKYSSDGYASWCKDCLNTYKRNTVDHKVHYQKYKDRQKEQKKQYYVDNKEILNQKNKERYQLNKETILANEKEKYQLLDSKKKRRKGLSKLAKRTGHSIDELEEFYSKKIIEQHGCCAICGISESKLKTRLHIDHDHQTKKLRALLCGRCNTVLGSVEESIKLLDQMKQFLVSQQ